MISSVRFAQNGRVIYYDSVGDLLYKAKKKDLRGAYLGGLDFRRHFLDGFDLRGASLVGADLRLATARSADMRDADLRSTALLHTCLDKTDLRGARLPSPTEVLLADWSAVELSDELTADLMVYDAACHPDPEAFDRWAANVMWGECPYGDGLIQRAAHFQEKRALWGTGQACRPHELMMRVLTEAGCLGER